MAAEVIWHSPSPLRVSLFASLEGAPRDVERVLLSLSTHCQRNVSGEAYEIILTRTPAVEALSAGGRAWEENVRLAPAANEGEGPLAAFDRAYTLCLGQVIGFLDVTAIVTPRLFEHVLGASRLYPEPLIVVPSYDFVSPESDPGAVEPLDDLLDPSRFPSRAYELFDRARFSDANPKGYLCSVFSAEAFFCTRSMIDAQKRRNAWSSLRTTNDLYARFLRRPTTRLVALGGEACFRLVRPPQAGWGWGNRIPVDRQPLLYGAMSGPAQPPLRLAVGEVAVRESVVREVMGLSEWQEDPQAPLGAQAKVNGEAPHAPLLSIVVVTYRCPRQVENTVYSLSTSHQWNVREEDYEIVVVENRSSAMLGEERALRLGGNVRYFERDEPGVSPAPALNFGVRQARAGAVGLMIDGARMVTPRVVEHALTALGVIERALVAVPGYHLGPGRQYITSRAGYDEAEEAKLLEGIAWKQAGYRLFEIGCFDDATGSGFLTPLLEATCLFCPKACFEEVGGLDERFDLPGGGEVNHDLFARLCRLPGTRYVVLWGEGSFHQYHGGVSTGSMEDREAKLVTFRKQHDELRGHRFATFEREPLLLGTCAGRAYERLMEAIALGHLRYGMRRMEGRREWPND